jgi:hypothetical protein
MRGIYGSVANLNFIKIRYILDRVAPGQIIHFIFGDFHNYETRIPGDNPEGFGQPVLVGGSTENF